MALAVAACGGGGDDDAADTTTTTAAATSTTAAAGGAISSIEDVQSAVVQVLATGTFRDPAEGTRGFAGSGSGFIIDPDGIVVTNNHVVTGAGAVKVRIGDSDEEVPARVLGVSECNDLAVLELVDPGPYPHLDWFAGEVVPAIDVYTAGFPLGDPEYTVTKGVVSKAEADGESSTSSVRHVIEHDANIQPGNSGGPLVDGEGQVVGVNYAGYDPGTGTLQFFAISADLAEPVVEALRAGDQETIGVNGEAIFYDDGASAGVWVSGVEAGSPAASAGVLPGDIITSLNGVPMSLGTMEAYCDVLRSAMPGEAIGIEVLRFDTEEVWAGELNGTPMVARFSFAQELAGDVPAGESGTASAYTYETVTDDTGTIAVQVPTVWSERDGSSQDLGGGTLQPAIQAAPDLAAFLSTDTAPGMVFLAVPKGAGGFPADVLLDEFAPAGCVDQGREDYSDSVFTGRAKSFVCGGTTLAVLVVANPNDNPDALVIVGVQAVSDADLEALDQILYTFNFV